MDVKVNTVYVDFENGPKQILTAIESDLMGKPDVVYDAPGKMSLEMSPSLKNQIEFTLVS